MGVTLRHGSCGRDVQRLQQLLNENLRHRPLLVDGHYGRRTEAAVRFYQTSVGLRVDGVAGPDTWRALEKGLVRHQGIASPVSKGFPSAPWMAIAMREVGQKEVEGPAENPRILEYHAATTLKARSEETAWCSSFANWCMQQAGIAGPKSAAAVSWMHWGKPSVARPGAITVIYNPEVAGSSLTASGYHVGFLLEEGASYYRLLGGNQHDEVRSWKFSKASWQLVGYRWPKI